MGKRFFKTTWVMNNIIAPARKNLVTAITKGCADIKPILVAADAEDQRIANKIPAAVNFIPDRLDKW